MSKNVILKKKNEYVLPITKVENIIDFPDLDALKASIKNEILSEIGNGGNSGNGDNSGNGGNSGSDNSSKYIYYGDSHVEIDPQSPNINSLVEALNRTTSKTISNVHINDSYYYIAIPNEYTINRIVSENMEVLTSDFILKGTYTSSNGLYKLYDYHLNSLIALDVDITITIN